MSILKLLENSSITRTSVLAVMCAVITSCAPSALPVLMGKQIDDNPAKAVAAQEVPRPSASQTTVTFVQEAGQGISAIRFDPPIKQALEAPQDQNSPSDEQRREAEHGAPEAKPGENAPRGITSEFESIGPMPIDETPAPRLEQGGEIPIFEGIPIEELGTPSLGETPVPNFPSIPTTPPNPDLVGPERDAPAFEEGIGVENLETLTPWLNEEPSPNVPISPMSPDPNLMSLHDDRTDGLPAFEEGIGIQGLDTRSLPQGQETLGQLHNNLIPKFTPVGPLKLGSN